MIPSESKRCSQTECAMNKKYIVRLTDEDRAQLTELTRKGQAAAYKIRHAHILLKADADGVCLDGYQDRRELLRECQYRAGCQTTLGRTGAGGRAQPEETAAPLLHSALGWRGRGKTDRSPVQCAARRACPMDPEAPGRPGCGVGHCGGDQP